MSILGIIWLKFILVSLVIGCYLGFRFGKNGIGPEEVVTHTLSGIKLPAFVWAFGVTLIVSLAPVVYYLIYFLIIVW